MNITIEIINQDNKNQCFLYICGIKKKITLKEFFDFLVYTKRFDEFELMKNKMIRNFTIQLHYHN